MSQRQTTFQFIITCTLNMAKQLFYPLVSGLNPILSIYVRNIMTLRQIFPFIMSTQVKMAVSTHPFPDTLSPCVLAARATSAPSRSSSEPSSRSRTATRARSRACARSSWPTSARWKCASTNWSAATTSWANRTRVSASESRYGRVSRTSTSSSYMAVCRPLCPWFRLTDTS